MKLLYGTANPAKLKTMRDILQDLDIEIIGLNDIDANTGSIDESGNNPLENARIKAMTYYKALQIPVFSCDSGLYIDGLDESRQPGTHVRRVGGKVLKDDEMIAYYSNLAMQNGGEVKARYKNAIALILDESKVISYDGEDISSVCFLITSKPHPKRTPGFPLDSISLELGTGRYYMDIRSGREMSNSSIAKGFRKFFTDYVLNRM